MLGATFHLFVLSLQTPKYETDEKKNIGNLRMQDVTGNEALVAPRYVDNQTSLYPHIHIVNNPIPIGSTWLNRNKMMLMCFILQEILPSIQTLVLTELLPVL